MTKHSNEKLEMPAVTRREHAHILAALRLWQRTEARERRDLTDDFIVNQGHELLDDYGGGIDELIERINMDSLPAAHR